MENWIEELKKSPDYLGDVEFAGYSCLLVKAQYSNGRTALQLVDQDDGEMVATATTNIPEVTLKADEIIIKNYSENDGMLQCLVDAGYVAETGKVTRTGHCIVPIAKLLKHGNPITDPGTTSAGAVPVSGEK